MFEGSDCYRTMLMTLNLLNLLNFTIINFISIYIVCQIHNRESIVWPLFMCFPKICIALIPLLHRLYVIKKSKLLYAFIIIKATFCITNNIITRFFQKTPRFWCFLSVWSAQRVSSLAVRMQPIVSCYMPVHGNLLGNFVQFSSC